MWELGTPVAHITGRAAIPGVALFLAGVAAALGASRFWGPPYTAVRRAMSWALPLAPLGFSSSRVFCRFSSTRGLALDH
jgi:hypothetical protein